MVLPAGINKASGLAAALARLRLSPLNVVGIGDAENDHAFLRACGCAVAVANALPMVKEDADLVASMPRGAGVAETIGRILDGVQRNRVLVGYGNGALAVIDPATRTKAADIRLKGHSESFQIDETGTQVFVNVPDAREIEIADLASQASRSLPMHGAGSNFPMAVDRDAHRVLVVFRSPPTLMALSSEDGRVLARIGTCGDADDVFVDPKRHRAYVSCGEGVVDVLEQREADYRRVVRVPTVSGARTSLFAPELDRLFVAVRARSNEPAAIWVFRPVP